jgi:hypothetical protein
VLNGADPTNLAIIVFICIIWFNTGAALALPSWLPSLYRLSFGCCLSVLRRAR